MWIEISPQLPSDIDQAITVAIGKREDREDSAWLDVSTGARLVLAANGGWRTAKDSAYHALYVSAAGEVIDVTYGLLGGKVPFDASQTGSDTYSPRRAACVKHIETVLGVSSHRLNYGQITPVQSI
ncbi:hypothetical protein [Pseudoxanthomonas mexicana]